MSISFNQHLHALPSDLRQLVLSTHLCIALGGHLLIHAPYGRPAHVATHVHTLLEQTYHLTPIHSVHGKSTTDDLSSLISSRAVPRALIVRHAPELSKTAQVAFLNALRDRRIVIKDGLPGAGSSYPIPDDFFMVFISTAPTGVPHFGLIPHLARPFAAELGLLGLNGVRQADRFALTCAWTTDEMLTEHLKPLEYQWEFQPEAMADLRQQAEAIYLGPRISLYIQDVLTAIRTDPALSPRHLTNRGNKDFERVARMWACIQGDGKTCRPSDLVLVKNVMLHRLTKRAPEERLAVRFMKEDPVEDHRPLGQILDEIMLKV